MSWGEVFKINSNLKKPLNEQLRDMTFQPVRVITETGTYTPEKSGLYKVICVGAGYNGEVVGSSHIAGGGGGGVAIKTLELNASTSYNVTVNGQASFNAILTATAGVRHDSDDISKGGTASGGDFNFTGEAGAKTSYRANTSNRGGSVGVVISGLNRQHSFTHSNGLFHVDGDCILNYGGGGSASAVSDTSSTRHSTDGHPAAVIIIPLEMEV